MTTTTRTDTADELAALAEQLEAATTATADARAELAAAKAARGDAIVAGTPQNSHSSRVLAARERLDVCLETEHALTRRRRSLVNDAPPTVSEASDSRTVRITVTGIPGQHACNQPSTGRKLHGGEELTLPADDALALVGHGYVRVVGQVPFWWPQGVPIPVESTLRALAGR